jgi:flagellar biosynthetic protein FlhB
VLAAGLSVWGAQLFGRLQVLFAGHFGQAAQMAPESALSLVRQSVFEILPFLAALFLAALIAPLILSGWVFAPLVVRFRGERLNPFASILRLFSAAGLFDGFKAVLKIAAVTLLLFAFYRMHLDGLAGLSSMPLPQAVETAGSVLIKGLMFVLGAVLLAALFDAPWQWWRYLRDLAMTRAEVMAEARESEGSPELKARIRARQNALRQKVAE